MKHARSDYDRIQDPLAKIPHDEPVFLIRGQDRVGGDAVRAWADLAQLAGARPKIVEAARQQAAAMDQWRHRHRDKISDMP